MPDRSPLPEHVTLPLLEVITRSSMDLDYEHVARQRSAAGEREHPTGTRWMAAAVVGVFGLLLVVAAVQTRASADTVALAREQLISQIQVRRAELAESHEEIDALREENQAASEGLARLSRRERVESSRALDLGAITGFSAVTGEGVRVTVDNAPDGGDNGRVWDEDLALLVDGLWAAGAEAISINGHRLTALSAIRTTGTAINVQNRPLRPPYVVEAIGDMDTLQARFVETGSGLAFLSLRNRFGIVVEMENDPSMSLAAAPRPQLTRAETVADDDLEVTE